MKRRIIDVGALKDRITFMRLGETEDDMGLTTQGLVPIATVWATFKPVRGSERYELYKMESDAKWKGYIRYSSDVKDITAEDYLIYNGHQYQLTDVIDVDNQHAMIEFYAVKKLNREEKQDERDII